MLKRVFYLRVLVGLMVFLMAAPPWILAQSSATGPFRQEELDQMLAPIALYPDSLLAQILVASTYPDQVTEADQWVRQNRSLQGDELNAALDHTEWDLSVKALVPFPEVLAMMSDKREWTQRMGDAFLAQQTDVMDTIQSLRAKAHAQGHLGNTDQQRVVVQGDNIEIQPANPRVVYVPTYNPTVIYGSWWNPAYPPYAYNPYYPQYAYDPHYSGVGFVTVGLFGFAAGIAVGSIWNSGWGHWDWHRHHVNVNINRTININRNDVRRGDIRTARWDRNIHRRGPRREGSEAIRRSGNATRTSGKAAVRTGSRPTAESVNKGLRERDNKARVSNRKATRQEAQANVRSDRSKTSRAKSSGKSGDQLNRGGSSGKSSGKTSGSEFSRKSRSSGNHDGSSNRVSKSRSGGSADHAKSKGKGKSHEKRD